MHLGTIRQFVLFRAGLAGAGAVRTLARVFSFPVRLCCICYSMQRPCMRRAFTRA